MNIRVFTAFSGYDSQCLALDRLHHDFPQFTYDLVGWSEIDTHAICAHNLIYPDAADRNYGDISKIDWHQVHDFDLFTYSFPCGLKGTLIKTSQGYRDISEIKEGEYVLTHNNRYRRVEKTMQRVSQSYYRIKARGCDLRLTSEHPLYVLRDGEEQWVKVSELRFTDKISYCIPSGNKPANIDNDTLWLLGRYCADGCGNPIHYNSANFVKGHKDKLLQALCLDFGSDAKNRHIPQWLIECPIEQIEVFLDGYIKGCGRLRYACSHNQWMFSTTSKQLFLGLQLLILKARKIVCPLYIHKDGRKLSGDTYSGYFGYSASNHDIRGERVYVPIKNIYFVEENVDVYNFEVEEDNSYTCDNVNVHNCQDISTAGLQRGFTEGSGTRSGLLWECRKAIEVKRPKFLLMENVKALTQKKFMPEFVRWQQCLAEMGYHNFYQVLNAKHFGVPQNRERVFMVSILADADTPHPHYQFPEPFPLDRCIGDVLEDDVDESYYLRQEQVDKIIAHCDRKQLEGCGFSTNFQPKDGIAGAIKTREGQREYDTYLKDTPPT